LTALRGFKPHLVHTVALKPAVYAYVVRTLTGIGSIVYALGGLGFVFSSRKPLARFLRPVLLGLFRRMFSKNNARLILQNPDDGALLLSANVVRPDRVRLIRGSGVDTSKFSPGPIPVGTPLVMLPARLLWDKGVGEFVAAARTLKGQGLAARFALVGGRDPHNPECIPADKVDAWVAEGVVEAWGNRDDMPEVLRQAAIVCLPSYREGLPKALLEAASCARPIVTFDVPGCREVVRDGDNGLLVPFKDIESLTKALATLISDPDLRERMGKAGREKVLSEFSQEQVAEETVRVWREVLA
jgi:glycosyltransferase involved in cell wall biosynthesis